MTKLRRDGRPGPARRRHRLVPLRRGLGRLVAARSVTAGPVRAVGAEDALARFWHSDLYGRARDIAKSRLKQEYRPAAEAAAAVTWSLGTQFSRLAGCLSRDLRILRVFTLGVTGFFRPVRRGLFNLPEQYEDLRCAL
jgi:hypothetical protein